MHPGYLATSFPNLFHTRACDKNIPNDDGEFCCKNWPLRRDRAGGGVGVAVVVCCELVSVPPTAPAAPAVAENRLPAPPPEARQPTHVTTRHNNTLQYSHFQPYKFCVYGVISKIKYPD